MKTRALWLLLFLPVLLVGCDLPLQASSSHATVSPTPTQPPIAGYLSTDQGDVIWTNWTEDTSGNFTGQWIAATMQNGKPAYLTYPTKGTHNQTGISMTIQAGLLAIPTTGTLENTILSLHMFADGTTKSLTLHGATMDEYNAALKTFKDKHPS